MHQIANLKNREFKSHPLLHIETFCSSYTGTTPNFTSPRHVKKCQEEQGYRGFKHRREFLYGLIVHIYKHMIDYFLAFFAIFFTDIFYTYYLRAVHEEQTVKASCWATIVYVIAAVAIIEYNANHWLLIPAGIGAFCGTWVGMKLRKNNSV